ncbi:hypothetical protein A3H86_04020 [Candidatus Roizmanbacteria bacterium RIFCSPLOWO2_02_FULL_41_9]|uniref:Oxidoreductase n=1 Tax=Candidatus Roizmanbacteria bacterium RIFCSPLOWO2_02_FULL_41_9 TaxID=1802077 RepID=A0A1F7JR90_9BACT|nr:MAG: hypothetical protein A3H86_04020 [Candidatus Roizmanbacteria bacterium RIFCSPLOWO2_02_FULL_41_9]
MDLQDKVLIITGASDGLGKGLALRLAKDKARVVLLARNQDKLKAVKEEIIKLGGKAEYFVCDVGKPEQVQSVVKSIKSAYGKIDVLINNAGIWTTGPLEAHPIDKIKDLFATNTLGTIFMTREVLPMMKAVKSGQILNVMSIAGVEEVDAYGIVYVATKHALQGFTDTLKQELQGTGIKVMGFYPGGMATNILAASGVKMEVDMKQMMRVEDIAEIIAFVLKQPADVVIDHFEVRKFT